MSHMADRIIPAAPACGQPTHLWISLKHPFDESLGVDHAVVVVALPYKRDISMTTTA
jgi:hypothetical protein